VRPTELERLEVCGAEMPGSAAILEKLRAELRKSEQPQKSAAAAQGEDGVYQRVGLSVRMPSSERETVTLLAP